MANTLNLSRNGAGLLAKAFGVGFIDWLGGGRGIILRCRWPSMEDKNLTVASFLTLTHQTVWGSASTDGYLLGLYRIATAPEPNSSRLTSFKSTRFDSHANNVGPWPASLGCTTNSYSSGPAPRFLVSAPADESSHGPAVDLVRHRH